MTVRVGSLRFHNWQAIEIHPDRWADAFIFDVSSDLLIPPVDMGLAIRRMGAPLKKLWSRTCLWVRVDAPGTWYLHEIRNALMGIASLPVAVTPFTQQKPRLSDFSLHPHLDNTPSPSPPSVTDIVTIPLTDSERHGLRVLARLRTAALVEIASQAGLTLPTTRKALHGLAEKSAVSWQPETETWEIHRRKGLSVALRGLGFPPGVSIPTEKRYNQGARHLRTARLWPAWLRQGLGKQAVIWAGWSEPRLSTRKAHPDAMAWGEFQGRETLFWLEVDSGQSSKEALVKKLLRRLNTAVVYARSFDLLVVIAVLGPPRTLKVVQQGLGKTPHDTAVVVAPWTKFGELPVPVWGNLTDGSPAPTQLRLL